MSFVCKYLALYVPDLQEAECFYRDVFGMELLFRESKAADGSWHALRPHVGWTDAASAGIPVDMLALSRDGFTLALFIGSPTAGTVHEVSVGVRATEIDEFRVRIESNGIAVESGRARLRFRDPFGFNWTVQSVDDAFRSSGEIAGRWIG